MDKPPFLWTTFVICDIFPADVVFRYHSYVLDSKIVIRDKEYNVLVNNKAKVALMTIASRFNCGQRDGSDSTLGRPRYYLTRSTVVIAARKFLNSELYSNYALIIDVSDTEHQGGLYIFRNNSGPRYTIYAFDPNQNAVGFCFRVMAKHIFDGIKSMNVWTTWSGNNDGLCFSLFWAFVHDVLHIIQLILSYVQFGMTSKQSVQ